MTSNAPLVLTRKAFSKLLYFARRIPHEVSCFGIAADPNNIFRITDFEVMPAKATAGSVVLDDHAIAMWIYEAGQRGLNNDQALRVYFHTQPGDADPSSVDMKTFYEELLPQASWMVMGIMSFAGETSALMGSIVHNRILRRKMKVLIDWEADYPLDGWQKEITSNIIHTPTVLRSSRQPDHATTTVTDRRRFLPNGEPNPQFVNWDDVERHRAGALAINQNDPLNQNGIEFDGKIYGPYDFDALNQARFKRSVRGGDVAADDPRLFEPQPEDDPILLEGEAAAALRKGDHTATFYADIGQQVRDKQASRAADAAVATAPRLKAKPLNKRRRRGRRKHR